jgi:hypothetical protein
LFPQHVKLHDALSRCMFVLTWMVNSWTTMINNDHVGKMRQT